MRKRTGLAALAVIFLLAFITIAADFGTVLAHAFRVEAAGKVYYVAKYGSDNNPGTESQPWLTIQKAASTLTAGDTVYVKAGIYNERVTPARSGSSGSWITYKTCGSDKAIIDGTGIHDHHNGVFEIDSLSCIEVNGFEIRNAAQWAGVKVCGESDNIVLKSLTVYNTPSSGIFVQRHEDAPEGLYVTNILIDSCEVYHTNSDNTQEAISLIMTDGFEIKNCRVHDSAAEGQGREGIDIKQGCRNGSVHHNEVYGTVVGIYIDSYGHSMENIQVYNNKTHDNANGIAFGGEEGAPLSDVSFFNNLVYNNVRGMASWQFGSPQTGISIINNTFYNNSEVAVQLLDAGMYDGCVIRNNIFMARTGSACLIEFPHSSGVSIDSNLFYSPFGYHPDNVYGTSYIWANPLFVDPAGANFALLSSSPAVNSGSPDGAPAVDYTGNPRPQSAVYDLGAYEYGGAAPSTMDTILQIARELPRIVRIGVDALRSFDFRVLPDD